MSPWALNQLGHAISAGAVFGYPTDTIWGFGCDPQNFSSVARILQIKNRGADKGLILLSSKLEYCLPYVELDRDQEERMQEQRERPTTWLATATGFCPWWIRGSHPSVAIRICNHPLLRVLCAQLKSPLVSTSANRAGRPTVRNALQLRHQFGDEVDYVVTGFETGGGQASEIISLASGTTLRSSS